MVCVLSRAKGEETRIQRWRSRLIRGKTVVARRKEGRVAYSTRLGIHVTFYCPKLKDAKDSTASTRFEWTVSASMFRDKPLVLADLTPELRNSFLQDVALHNPVLLIASCDEPRVPKEVNIPPAIASKGEFILISM